VQYANSFSTTLRNLRASVPQIVHGMLSAAFICFLLARASAADDPVNPFQGEWHTTISVVKLEQKGDVVTGTYGNAGQFQLKGAAKGNVLTFELEEGQVKGDGKFTLDATGNAFAGSFQVRNGRSGIWNGWRPDPKAPSDKPGAFGGLWLTDLGLMEITQTGSEVQAKYALRGTSKLEGKATGRHLEFKFNSFRDGHGWFDISPDGKSLSGAANTDGFPGWFGWRGQPAPAFVRHAPLVPGKTVDGSAQNLLTYSVHAPEGYKPGAPHKWPAVVILHGSNMNGRSYVDTIVAAWPEIARDFIILGLNGETPSALGDDLRFNYTYVNYVGKSTFKGYPGTDRESPALVSQAMFDLKEAYPIDHYLVGGHSQGGFLTYSLLMNFPESMAGAFPISSGVIFQCEPGAYADPALKADQRKIPLAIIHGKNDPVMGFGMGQYAATLFGEAGWPAFHFFTDDSAAHMFARLPVGPAIRWLEAMSSNDPAALVDFAAKSISKKAYRDAIAAIGRARSLTLDDGQKRRLDELGREIDAKAAPDAARYRALIREAKDGSWIEGFLAFRDNFEFAPAAREVMAAFAELRKSHDTPAQKAFGEARGLFQQGKQDEGYAKYKEIVDKGYASSQYRIVKRWLDERK
jgi:predicted esterase